MTLQIALTGINAASTELETISNNIANNATTGFKRSRVEFADALAASGGSSKTKTGQGVTVTNVRQEHTQGSLSTTSRNLDLAIEGQGMFRLDDGGKPVYTRAGNFGLDEEGFVVNSEGQFLTGFSVNRDNQIQPVIDKLQIEYEDLAPKTTTEVEFAMNFDITAEVLPPFDVTDQETFNYSTSVAVYDSLGASNLANIYFKKDAPNTWSVFTLVDGVEVSQAGGDAVTFSSAGELDSVNALPSFKYSSGSFSPKSGAEPMQVTFDLGQATQYDNGFGISKISQDGFAAGSLEEFNIDENGVLLGQFSNGQTKRMGQVGLTNFSNVGGLKQVGNTGWIETEESGTPATGTPRSASLGAVRAGSVEGSNVDLTQELVAMIGAQRSFQANAQVISTSDTITQTIINLR